MLDIQTIVTDAVAVVVGVGSTWVMLKKRFPTETKVISNEITHNLPHAVLTGIEDAVKFIEHLGESPLFAAEVAKGKLEAHHVLGKLEQTTAVSEAKTILLGIGKVYDALSAQEKVKAEVTLRLALSQLGINMTDAQIQGVFNEAQKAIDSLKSTAMFKASFEQPAPAPEPAPQA